MRSKAFALCVIFAVFLMPLFTYSMRQQAFKYYRNGECPDFSSSLMLDQVSSIYCFVKEDCSGFFNKVKEDKKGQNILQGLFLSKHYKIGHVVKIFEELGGKASCFLNKKVVVKRIKDVRDNIAKKRKKSVNKKELEEADEDEIAISYYESFFQKIGFLDGEPKKEKSKKKKNKLKFSEKVSNTNPLFTSCEEEDDDQEV